MSIFSTILDSLSGATRDVLDITREHRHALALSGELSAKLRGRAAMCRLRAKQLRERGRNGWRQRRLLARAERFEVEADALDERREQSGP